MKKFVCMLFVLVICLSLAVPVFAEDNFVPSIAYKPEPEIVPVVDENQEEQIGVLKNADGEVLGYVGEGCLLTTPVAHVWDDEKEVPAEVKELLLSVYNGLNDGSLEISYDKFEAGLDAANMVIRDLFDARFYCEECTKLLEPEGAVMELTFDLGVVADAQIYAQTYDENTKEWTPVVKTVNNGDGTVTCTFEHLCAIAFSMPIVGSDTPSVPGGSDTTPNVLPWIIALVVAVVAVAAIFVGIALKKKKTAV